TMYQLSPGSCQRLHDTVSPYDPILNQPHILQILAIKALTSANSVDRYRVILSDGVHFIQAVFATQLNQYVQEKQIQRYSVISIEKMACNQLQEK
ncbi:Replication factor-A protein 1, N-terminal domain containing protein, partial [Amanita muscaria]